MKFNDAIERFRSKEKIEVAKKLGINLSEFQRKKRQIKINKRWQKLT